MGIQDRDYYREKRDYQNSIRENQEPIIGYLFKRSFKTLIRRTLIWVSLTLIFLMIFNYYEPQLRDIFQTSYHSSNDFMIQRKSDQVDWSKISSCISNKTSCICYGKSSERLVIPPETCRNAVKHGWSSKAM